MKAIASVAACVLSLATACAQPVSPNGEQQSRPEERDAAHTWIERPWDMRYFIQVEDMNDWKINQETAKARNSDPRTRPFGFNWKEHFTPTTVLSSSATHQKIAVVIVEFDERGLVTTHHSVGEPLTGHLNQLSSMTLSAGDQADSRLYKLGTWFTGIGDDSTHWAPALCLVNQRPDPAQVRSDNYLYGQRFRTDEFSTTFGCREWASQLYDATRPYIDVTSYVPKGRTFSAGSYIREFIGWARFEDNKPVIGRHEGTWYCLHDCPAGDKPGAIADIRAWAHRHSWPVPRQPSKMPMFPDPPATSGTYPR